MYYAHDNGGISWEDIFCGYKDNYRYNFVRILQRRCNYNTIIED